MEAPQNRHGYRLNGLEAWIGPDGADFVFGCTNRNPDEAIRRAGIDDYNGSWVC